MTQINADTALSSFAGAPVVEAILRGWALIEVTPFKARAGKISMSGRIYRHLEFCPLCGQQRLAGTVEIEHQDGRSARFDVILVHYAKAGHPIADSDVDGDTLVALMADA